MVLRARVTRHDGSTSTTMLRACTIRHGCGHVMCRCPVRSDGSAGGKPLPIEDSRLGNAFSERCRTTRAGSLRRRDGGLDVGVRLARRVNHPEEHARVRGEGAARGAESSRPPQFHAEHIHGGIRSRAHPA